MDQRDFNRDMDAYLKDRTRERSDAGIMGKLKRSLPKVTVVSDEEPEQPKPEEVPREHVEAVLRGEAVPKPEPEESYDDVSLEVEDGVSKSGGFWQRWFGWLSPSAGTDFDGSPVEDVDLSELDSKPKRGQIDADVKEMLRICVHWVNMLPSEKIQDIKRSDDFVKFKQLLDKYDLLKKKE